MILYQGPSLYDNAPIVVIAQPSWNRKTGTMLGTWILRSDVEPSQAAADGRDSSICGDCKYRAQKPVLTNGVKSDWWDIRRACYVRTDWDSDVLYKRLHDNEFKDYSPPTDLLYDEWEQWAKKVNPYHLPVRIGSYGDPAVIPIGVWGSLVATADRFTGYTHLYEGKSCSPELKKYCMASVDSLEERERAQAAGWRTFHVSHNVAKDDIPCPAAKEQGNKTTCDQCRLCMGTTIQCVKSISICPHGPGKELIPVETL